MESDPGLDHIRQYNRRASTYAGAAVHEHTSIRMFFDIITYKRECQIEKRRDIKIGLVLHSNEHTLNAGSYIFAPRVNIHSALQHVDVIRRMCTVDHEAYSVALELRNIRCREHVANIHSIPYSIHLFYNIHLIILAVITHIWALPIADLEKQHEDAKITVMAYRRWYT